MSTILEIDFVHESHGSLVSFGHAVEFINDVVDCSYDVTAALVWKELSRAFCTRVVLSGLQANRSKLIGDIVSMLREDIPHLKAVPREELAHALVRRLVPDDPFNSVVSAIRASVGLHRLFEFLGSETRAHAWLGESILLSRFERSWVDSLIADVELMVHRELSNGVLSEILKIDVPGVSNDQVYRSAVKRLVDDAFEALTAEAFGRARFGLGFDLAARVRLSLAEWVRLGAPLPESAGCIALRRISMNSPVLLSVEVLQAMGVGTVALALPVVFALFVAKLHKRGTGDGTMLESVREKMKSLDFGGLERDVLDAGVQLEALDKKREAHSVGIGLKLSWRKASVELVIDHRRGERGDRGGDA